ncbi:MAG: HEAT repeat domain-containing protein [Proteobacteria bacterium]|nr:HEAT repeat domain-containing protein [Pseudomonadota bacterium]
MARLALRLRSADVAGQKQAVDQLCRLGRASEPVRVLDAFVREGQSDELTDHVLDALGRIGRVEAIPVLSLFAQHRRTAARRRAYAALGRIRQGRVRQGRARYGGVVPLLLQGLRDSDPGVRTAAALALAERDASGHVGTLFVALERGVFAASKAIGRLGDAASVERFTRYTGRIPLRAVLAGYEQYLARSDLDDQAKLSIVAALRELATPTARTFLQSQLSRLPRVGHPRLKAAMGSAIRRIRKTPLRTGVKPP